MNEIILKIFRMIAKHATFPRLVVLLVVVGAISIMSFNVGYDGKRGGFYCKPIPVDIDIDLKKEKN